MNRDKPRIGAGVMKANHTKEAVIALKAIADSTINTDTNHEELTALMITVARTTLDNITKEEAQQQLSNKAYDNPHII
jgi:hypothetical protein